MPELDEAEFPVKGWSASNRDHHRTVDYYDDIASCHRNGKKPAHQSPNEGLAKRELNQSKSVICSQVRWSKSMRCASPRIASTDSGQHIGSD